MTSQHSHTPDFSRRIRSIYQRFFVRDARLWPIYADPAFAAVIDFRRQHLPPGDALADYRWENDTAVYAVGSGIYQSQRKRNNQS